jgi:hypothetical protein
MRWVVRSAAIVIAILTIDITSVAVEISGYYEPQYLIVELSGDYSQLFTNKLRVDLSTSTDNIHLFANFDFISYHGKREWNLLDFLPQEIADPHRSGDQSEFLFTYDDSIFLDNAYLKIAFGRFDFTVGRQQISLGTGYAWNPTDLFNFKEISDPTYEQPGHNALRLDISVTGNTGLSLLYDPEDNWERSTKLVRYKGNLSHFDYSAIFIEREWEEYDYLNSSEVRYRRRLLGGDLVGQLLGLGVWGEWGYNRVDARQDFWELLWGLDYTLDDGTYLMAEYYRNGQGRPDYGEYDVNDWMRYFTARSKTISRDNLYLYLNYPLTDLLELSNSFVLSLSDGSLALVPGLHSTLFQNLELDCFVTINTGREGRAYTRGAGTTSTFRLRAYF